MKDTSKQKDYPSESPAWAAATASKSIARATGMLLEEDPRTHASRRNSSAAVQPATGTKSASSSSSTHLPSDSCRATWAACALRSAWTASKASRARPQAPFMTWNNATVDLSPTQSSFRSLSNAMFAS